MDNRGFHHPSPTAPRPRSRLWRWLSLGGLGLVHLSCGACLVAIMLGGQQPVPPTASRADSPPEAGGDGLTALASHLEPGACHAEGPSAALLCRHFYFDDPMGVAVQVIPTANRRRIAVLASSSSLSDFGDAERREFLELEAAALTEAGLSNDDLLIALRGRAFFGGSAI